MARIFAIDDVPKALKDGLAKALRPEDEAVLLPSADLDPTSGKYENVVFRFDGTERDVPQTVFSPAWVPATPLPITFRPSPTMTRRAAGSRARSLRTPRAQPRLPTS